MLVTCNRVEGVQFDFESNAYYKTYKEQPDFIPFSFIMRKRDPAHPMSCLNLRIGKNPERELRVAQSVICLTLDKFALCGKIGNVDFRKQVVKVEFDKASEEQKLHDPFMGKKHISELFATKSEEMEKAKSFFGDQDIEQMMKLKGGIISRVTSSFLISYRNPDNGDKMVVDVGLNIKNFTKKLHVPIFVRFV